MKASAEEKRIDLNDLLKKSKDRKKEERKTNLIIVTGALSASVIVIAVAILSF